MPRSTKPRASRMRRTFGVVAATGAAAALLFGGTAVVPQASPVLAPQEAQAGVVCNGSLGLICGRIYNKASSNVKINVHDGWSSNPKVPAGKVQQVAPGKSSTFKDADGYCIPPKTQATVNVYTLGGKLVHTYKYSKASGWQCQKITDDQTAYAKATQSK